MKNVAIIGSTGSIGTQTLEIVRVQEDLNIVALAAGSNIELLEKQAREFSPEVGNMERRECCETQRVPCGH